MKPFLTFLFALSISSVHAQQVPADITFFSLPEKIKELRKSVLSIECIGLNQDIKKTPPRKLGSGFYARKSGVNYTITNYHIARQVGKDQGILVGFNSTQGKICFLATVAKFDSAKDIAVLAFTEYFQSTSHIDTAKGKLEQAALGISMFGDSLDTIEGTGTIIIGFPLGLGTEFVSNLPVSRIGIVAQAIRANGTFLLDATASHGNSGSPVFNLQSGKLVGMIVGFPPDRIPAFDEDGFLIANLPYNSGLSLCISAKEIIKIIP